MSSIALLGLEHSHNTDEHTEGEIQAEHIENH
jgi:hypothetical protein